MTQTALEAFNYLLDDCVKGLDQEIRSEEIALIRAALTAPVGLEWRDNFVYFNGRHIGHSFKIGDQGAGYYLFSNQSVTGLQTEAEARAALETAAREWLRIPTQPNVTELVEALAEFDRLSLVVESGVRTCNGADHQNTKDVWALIKKTRTTLSRAKGG